MENKYISKSNDWYGLATDITTHKGFCEYFKVQMQNKMTAPHPFKTDKTE